MKAIKLEVKGNWAQFRRAETNNNPLSHDLITKTAFIGMIGAVLGIERREMKELFPIFCEDFLYGVQIVNEVNKQSWGFTLRKAGDAWSKAPGQMEFIRNPSYVIVLALNNKRSEEIFDKFSKFCREGTACFEPVLGLHNCPAEISFISEEEISKIDNSTFTTKGFVTNQHKMEELSNFTFRLGFDKIPTYQNNDFWNLPDRFVQLIYPSGGNSIKVNGEHFTFKDNSNWCLV